MLIRFDLLSVRCKLLLCLIFHAFSRNLFSANGTFTCLVWYICEYFLSVIFSLWAESRFLESFFFSLKGQRKLIWRIQQKIILIKCCFFFGKEVNEVSSEKISFHEKVNKKVSVARLKGRRVYIRQRTMKPENFLPSWKRFSWWRSFLLISPHRSRRESLI